jgi:hypothetical protein
VSASGQEQLATIAEVQSMWAQWLKDQGVDRYDPIAAAEYRAGGSVDDETGERQSDYEEHANIVSASREEWLAYMAMLTARGINVSGEGLS